MRKIDVFFYDLLADQSLLRARGVTPANPIAASVSGYQLRIGKRATLVPAPSGRVFGLVSSVSHNHLEHLYSEPGAPGYRPEAVIAHLSNGELLAALCFNLIEPPAIGESDPGYAAELRALAERLRFPAEYVASIV